MKNTFLIFYILIYFTVKAQDSILIRLEGNVIESYLKTSIKTPTISIYFSVDLKYIVQGDSVGKFIFEKKIPKRYFEAMLLIEASGRYMKLRNGISFDTTKAQDLIQKEFEISPEITCIDTWILSDLLFNKNKVEYNKYTYFNDGKDSLLTDSVINKWCNKFMNYYINNGYNIEIVSFADFDEKNIISKKRLKFVYNKLINEGIPREKLIMTNRNKEKRYFYKYRDGCHPYYIIESQPKIIDLDLINNTANSQEKELYRSLRRVVTFNWKQNKN